MNQWDYIESGFRVFGLLGRKDHNGDTLPEKEQYKKPWASGWQHTPDWSDEQLSVMDEMGQFDTGFGVLVNGFLIIDVDARNGGLESFSKLCKDLKTDFLGDCGFAVSTGSGGGSMHLYYRLNEKLSLMQHHNSYPGIDFKTTGYVVGCGSLHASGNSYEELHGSPDKVTDAPQSIIELLTRPEYHRAEVDGSMVDLSDDDLRDILSAIPPDCDYDTWIRVGMALHDAANGCGIDMFDEWSQKGEKYPGFDKIERHWHSFGKSSNPVKLGTLIHYAREHGWQFEYDDSVTFVASPEFTEDMHTIETANVDLKRPPGLVGDVSAWIESQCRFPIENLSVAAALTFVGNIIGMRYKDEQEGVTTNLFTFCVAGSGRGKESIQQAFIKLMKETGISGAIHGAFKSEQEVIRNLLRHQMAAYCVDEMGIVLRKVVNSSKRGGASYLEGLIGLLMSAYSKADGILPISGDVKDEVKKALQAELAMCRKRVEENEDTNGYNEKRLPQLERSLSEIEQGIVNPFLSLIGFTTPVTFNEIVDYEMATNGAIGRSLIFQELETNPRRKEKFKKSPLPDNLKYSLINLYSPGEFENAAVTRIEYHGEKIPIRTTDDALAMMDIAYDEFWQQGEQHKQNTGLEAIPRRGYELLCKVSTILAAPSGVRTTEHVRWAYKLVKADLETKLKLAYANMKSESNDISDSVRARVMNCLSKDHGETLGVLVNRCRPHKRDVVEKAIESLLQTGTIMSLEVVSEKNNRKSLKYFEA